MQNSKIHQKRNNSQIIPEAHFKFIFRKKNQRKSCFDDINQNFRC